ncbi:serine/threonine-protein kinase [Halioglobus maricola]|uniref:Serine/threonine-protein kinase n=1 Tax=Halioglobus maricola TaxID=2601894 RepID=A0A5P9NM07_9GAMM|nr:serine/threonine-protein kinase [Halioglobus maricola]QFU75958.1 serine/threonine-protein kinase [Halioglobus maricola]
MDESTTIVANRYEIIRSLGRGGMGEVYLAMDVTLDREVAIKYLRSDLPEGEWRERMRGEARLLAQLNHPNIVQIHDILDEDDVPAMVMEYVDGRNLFLYMREHRVDLSQRLHWLAQIASGIAASHDQGICHRDLKAENVLIGPGKIAKVNDFGIASEGGDPQTDILALGNLAAQVLADCREAPAPGIPLLLERMCADNLSRRPTAKEAAHQLQLAYYESTQEETPLPGQVDEHQLAQGRKRKLAFAGAASIAIAICATWFLTRPVVVKNVAVAPASILAAQEFDDRQLRLLRTALNQSLRQNVIDSPNLALVRYSEQELEAQTPSELLALLAADSLLIPTLDCGAHTCELALDRVEAPDASVSHQLNTTLLLDSALDVAQLVSGQWHTLFPNSRMTTGQAADAITEDDYRSYLNIYLAHEQSSLPAVEMFQDLESLLESAPAYAPAYRLLADVGSLAYQTMSDPKYLEAMERQLENGDRRVSSPQALDYAWFDFYQASGDIEKMRSTRARIIQHDPNPVLANYMQGDIESAALNFTAAAQNYQRTLDLQPTSDHYYQLGRSLYFSGDSSAAVDVLESLVQRFPYHAQGLNLLAIIQFEKWELAEAISNWERSLAVRDDPLVRSNLGSAYLYLDDYDTAREQFIKAYSADSQDAVMVLNLADVESLLGNIARANALYGELVERYRAEDPMVFPEAAAQAAAHLGLYEQALGIVKNQETDFNGNPLKNFSDALVYTIAGQTISALVEVDSAIKAGLAAQFFDLPWFDRLCAEQRFVQIMSEGANSARCP